MHSPRVWTSQGPNLRQPMKPVDCGSYYASYHGHREEHLVKVRQILAEQVGFRKFIYLCGDSSLDNKHWFFDPTKLKEHQMRDPAFTAECVNGFDKVLSPPRMVKDVAYWMNYEAEQRSANICTVMSAVEESTIAARDNRLLEQDVFIREHITKDDCLVVSVGGNDVALRPTFWTIFYMVLLTNSPDWMIRNHIAPGFGYFVTLFGSKISELISRIISKERPHRILVCMIYYLDEIAGGSWADYTLSKLGYDANPAKLQLIIRCLFTAIRSKGLAIGGPAEGVHCFPLFAVLNGKDTNDYVQRVEPSVEGGRKMAEALMDTLLADDAEGAIDALMDRRNASHYVTTL